MRTTRPIFDLQLGNTRFSEVGLWDRIVSIRRNLNNYRQSHPSGTESKKKGGVGTGGPKTGRGRRLARINTLSVTLDNKDGELNDILRLGYKLKLWLGYADYPLQRGGTYRIEKFSRKGNATAGQHIVLSALGIASKMARYYPVMPFSHGTASDLAEEVARHFGLATSITPLREPITIVKADDESLLSFMERIAFDVGYDFWVDDLEEPAVLHFEPPEARDAIQIGGKKITLGYGSDSIASVLVEEYSDEMNIASASVSTTQRNKAGQVTKVGDPTTGLLRDVVASESLASAPASTMGQAGQAQRNARLADAVTTKRVLSVKINPGVPWWNLNQLVPWDLGGVFRLVDITDDISKNGYKSELRAVIGGGKASKKQQKKNGPDYTAGDPTTGLTRPIVLQR